MTDPPLAVDVDGTLTHPDQSIDPRVLPVLREWEAPVVIATGKSLPFPVALCDFVGIDTNVVVENGGVVAVGETVVFDGDREAAQAVADEYVAAGYDLGWGPADFANRWRETEVAVHRDAPLDPLSDLAAEHGLEVVDTGYAYHVKSPSVDKGTGLLTAAEELDRDPETFVAIGDSENDAELFSLVGRAYAVANADETAKAAADRVTDSPFADGFLEAVETIRNAED